MVLGRIILLIAILSFTLVLTWQTIAEGDLSKAWNNLRVPADTPAFVDTRTITHSIACKAQGFDPYFTGRCDPLGRLYNYPPIWLGLPVGPEDTILIGIMIAVFFAVILLFITDLRLWSSSLILAATVISPPVLLGVAQGNSDLLIFSLLCMILLYSPRPMFLVMSGVALTILKLYPIAMFGYIARFQKKSSLAVALALMVVAFLAVLLTSGDRLGHALANTPISSWRSYGAPVLVFRLVHGTATRYELYSMYDIVSLRVFPFLAFMLVGSIFAIGFFRWPAMQIFLPKVGPETKDYPLVEACSLIFLATFLLGTNFSYRLIFIVPSVIASLQSYEKNFDLKTLVFPALTCVYFWLTPYNSLPLDVLSGIIFILVFSAIALNFFQAQASYSIDSFEHAKN